MENKVYISSDGTEQNISTMHYEHLVNALSKSLREIYNSKNIEEFNKYMSNIELIQRECLERINRFLATKIDDEEWL